MNIRMPHVCLLGKCIFINILYIEVFDYFVKIGIVLNSEASY